MVTYNAYFIIYETQFGLFILYYQHYLIIYIKIFFIDKKNLGWVQVNVLEIKHRADQGSASECPHDG